MAQKRESSVTETVETKRVKNSAAKAARNMKRDADDAEKPVRKVKPKPRLSSNPKSKSSQSTAITAAVNTSKYFQSPRKNEEIDSDDDFDLVTLPAPVVKAHAKKPETAKAMDDSEEEDDDWEEVEELDGPLGPVEPQEPALPTQPVQIDIETPEVRKKKKRQAEFETYLRRMMNKYKKDVLIDTHKVHLLCLIASGMFHNRQCSEPDLLAITLSLLPTHFGMVAKQRIDNNYLTGLLKWFRGTFTLNPDLPSEDHIDPRALLERRLASLSARNHQEMTHLFLLVLRSLQLFCRLVLSLQPISFKPPSAKGKGSRTSAGEASSTSSEPKISPGSKRQAPADNAKGERGGKKAKSKEVKEEERAVTAGGQRPKNSKRRSVASKVTYKEESSDEEEEGASDEEEFQVNSEEDSDESEEETKSSKRGKGRSKAKVMNNKNTAAPRRTSGGGKKQIKDEEDRDEEDKKGGDQETSNGTKGKSGKKTRSGGDTWLEVYLVKTASWLCVDVEHGVGMPHLCSQNATRPVTYVVSVDGDGFLKDLGRKYDPTWMTSSRKRRVDEDWWDETLAPFLGPEDEKDKKEDKELHSKLLNKPLPISVAEYKNHPLYALRRHLLKYEAIYPPTATVLGYCKGEPVYSRACVHTLHSRDTWLKEARTARLGEEPYKMVKGFSNRSRKARAMSEQKDENDLALFGEWQTEEYQPPIAVDGKVPRNDYGNVYLFKPCMLPVGCVHLRLSNLNRVARKLGLDAAPAVTGFDFHGGYSHAVTDGYIVCEEHEEIFRAAWVEEQEIQRQKEKEKKEKRAVSNWTLLVKGLLIRERLKQRYGKKHLVLGSLEQEAQANGFSSDEEKAEGESPPSKTASETLAMSWPQNRQAKEDGENTSGMKRKATSKRERKGQEEHMFPFEKV